MSNVLPPEAKRATWRMYRARFLIAGSFAALAIAGFSALALVPSYLVLRVGRESAVAQNSSEMTGIQEDRSAIAHAHALIRALSPLLSSTTTPSASIAKVVTLRPAGIVVNHIALTTGHPGALVVSGVADTAEAISRYQNALRADSSFTSASVPVGDLAGTGNGQFSITLSGNF